MTRQDLIEAIVEAKTNTTPAGRLKFATHGRMIYGHKGSNAQWEGRKNWIRLAKRYQPAFSPWAEKIGLIEPNSIFKVKYSGKV
jgi:hypothetical protein